jgi:hypothetical protein
MTQGVSVRWSVSLLVSGLTASLAAAQALPPAPPTPGGGIQPASVREELRGTSVTIDTLKALAPPEWRPERPQDRSVTYQFRLPKKRNDPGDAELVVQPNVRGSVEANLRRYKDLFVPPPNTLPEEAAKVETYRVGAASVTALDVQGTYLFKDRPADANVKEDVRPDYRMLAVLVVTNEGTHLVRMVGPRSTVGHYKKEFENWVKSFK